MICPVELARDMSALQAARVGDHPGHDEISFRSNSHRLERHPAPAGRDVN